MKFIVQIPTFDGTIQEDTVEFPDFIRVLIGHSGSLEFYSTEGTIKAYAHGEWLKVFKV